MATFQRFLRASSATIPRQCASAATLFTLGDVIAQQAIEKRGSKHDYVRTARLTAYGGLIFAPIMSQWFGKILERVPYKGTKGVVAKVAADQILAAPAVVAMFFTATTLMEGKGVDGVKEKLKTSWWPTLQMGWLVWAPVQTINMAFVPPTQRLLFVNVVSIAWNSYLSVVSGKSSAPEKVTELRDDIPISVRV